MPLLYRLLADLVVIAHAGVVAFVIVGLVLVLMGALWKWQWVRNIWFRVLHLAMILVVVLEAWCGITCPFTVWEQRLRQLAGQTTYEGAFIANIVHDLLFYDAPMWVFTVCYTVFGALVLATFWLVPPRWRRASRDEEGRRSRPRRDAG